MGCTDKLLSLLQPVGGVFSGLSYTRTAPGEPRFDICSVTIGDLRWLLDRSNARSCRRLPVAAATLRGTGTGVSRSEACTRALAEAVERYSTCFYDEDQLIVASAQELGNDCMDLNTVPRCSAAELANPRCPLIAPDKRSRIRWVQAISLHEGRIQYVPAVMVYLFPGYKEPGERISFPITTGCAAYTTYEGAVLRGMLEVIERDAISVVWLQRMSLPRIVVDSIPDALTEVWRRYEARVSAFEYLFLDAMTDTAVPTVYAVQTATRDPCAHTLIACASACDYPTALAKVIEDIGALRTAFRRGVRPPDDYRNCREVLDGAAFMGRPECAKHFAFLAMSKERRTLRSLSGDKCVSDIDRVRSILVTLVRLGMDVYVVDLTTDEAHQAGLYVVKVLIPQLQPVSFVYRARFLGHQRLYAVPDRMNVTCNAESELNEWPQPFA